MGSIERSPEPPAWAARLGAVEAHPTIAHGWRRPGSTLVHVDVEAVVAELESRRRPA